MARSDLVEQLENALTDEAYDGGNGALSEEQFTKLVRTLAATAAAVVTEVRTPTADESAALAAIERAKAFLTDVSETNEMRNRNAYGALKGITEERGGADV